MATAKRTQQGLHDATAKRVGTKGQSLPKKPSKPSKKSLAPTSSSRATYARATYPYIDFSDLASHVIYMADDIWQEDLES
jgi:hypothetical protein